MMTMPRRLTADELAELSIGDRFRLCPHPEWRHIKDNIYRCVDCNYPTQRHIATRSHGGRVCSTCFERFPHGAFAGPYCGTCRSLMQAIGLRAHELRDLLAEGIEP